MGTGGIVVATSLDRVNAKEVPAAVPTRFSEVDVTSPTTGSVMESLYPLMEAGWVGVSVAIIVCSVDEVEVNRETLDKRILDG